jgi:hypothetical protein
VHIVFMHQPSRKLHIERVGKRLIYIQMDFKNLVLSEDQKEILDLDGNVVFIATQDEQGKEYFTTPDSLKRGKVCIGWTTNEVCVKWGKEGNEKICLSWTSKQFCVEWSS